MNYYIGIDIGATNTKLGIVNSNGTILKEKYFNSKAHPPKKLLKKLSQEINRVKKNYELEGIGIGVAGPTNPKEGKVYHFINLPGWENIEITNLIKNETGIDTYLDNDTNIMSLGEKEFGAGKDFKNFICLTLGTGVGGSLVLNNKIYRGSKYVAGEIGHVPININGPNCNCGGKGCLERYVGNKYIIERTKSQLKEESNSIIMKLADGNKENITPKIISKAYYLGDKLAKEIWLDTGKYIGIALTGTINLLNPEAIIIGGGVAEAGNVLFDSIYSTIQKRAMRLHKQDIKVLKTQLGEKAGIIGASVLAQGLREV